MDIALLIFFCLLIVGSLPLIISLISTGQDDHDDEISEKHDESDEENEPKINKDLQPEPSNENPDQESPAQSAPSNGEDDSSRNNDELPFEPTYTFTPNSEQWSDSYQSENQFPWPELSHEDQNIYDDEEEPEPSSNDLESAIDWLTDSSTEAIHKENEYQNFIKNLLSYIQNPRVEGAQYAKEAVWRNRSPHLSRLVGERLIVMAMGLSSYGARFMNSHVNFFKTLNKESWANDDLENPLLYQCIGRLGLLTPTELGNLQTKISDQITALFPSGEASKLEKAHFNSALFLLSTGDQYPFPKGQNGLSRLWHWDEHNPPLATWDDILPVLYTLWIFFWVNEDSAGAANELGAMLGSWWDDNGPSSEQIKENPDLWEAILMTAWALAPEQSMIWDQIQRRYEEFRDKSDRLKNMTEVYKNWHKDFIDSGNPPSNSFTGQRMPPREWIQPLPSELLSDHSQPPFDYPEPWCNELQRLDEPNFQNLRDL